MAGIGETAAAGRTSFGSWITIANPLSAEAMARAGFDWLILDAQHGGVTPDNLPGLLQAVELGGTQAIVRVAWNDPAQIMRALDLGAGGVIVPMVSSAEDARRAVEAVRYPPLGQRSFGKLRTPYAPSASTAQEPLCLVMIETAAALARLDEIAATPGIDGLFVGPADLSLSMGFAFTTDLAPEVMTAIATVVTAAGRHGILSGSASFGSDNAMALVAMGMGFITLGSDMGMIRRGAAAEVGHARQWTAQAVSVAPVDG
ncbi:MAG TPA: aldolase/citrate lyase family protein [Sphingobium sp.]